MVIISYLLQENVFQWRIMLYLEAAIALVPAVIFALYISAEVQPWNDGNYTGLYACVSVLLISKT